MRARASSRALSSQEAQVLKRQFGEPDVKKDTVGEHDVKKDTDALPALGFEIEFFKVQDDENILPMAEAMAAMDKEIDSVNVKGCFGALYCWYWKERNIALSCETEHMITRLQSYCDANLRMKTTSSQFGTEQMKEVQLELLNTMRTEFKHATPFIQNFVRLFDLACMKFLKYIAVSDEDTVFSTLQKENQKILEVIHPRKTPFCAMLRIIVFKRILNSEFDSFQGKLLFGSIWQMPKIWEMRNKESVINSSFPTEAMNTCKEALRICIDEIPSITGIVLDELLPAFLQKMNQLQATYRQQVDLGLSAQNKVLAAMASTIFGILTYLVQRQSSKRDVLPDLHLREIKQEIETHPGEVWHKGILAIAIVVVVAICVSAVIIAVLCSRWLKSRKPYESGFARLSDPEIGHSTLNLPETGSSMLNQQGKYAPLTKLDSISEE